MRGTGRRSFSSQATIAAAGLAVALALCARGSLAEPLVCYEPSSQFTAADPAGQDLAARAYDRAEWVFEHAFRTHYEHLHKGAHAQVRTLGPDACEAMDDCSGFISNVIDSVSPSHYQAILDTQPGRRYPQAKAFALFFGGIRAESPRSGWLRVGSVRNLRRGDIIAWAKERPAGEKRRGNSGHVMMVIDPPGEVAVAMVEGVPVRFISVHVIDSSSVVHFPPETLPPAAGQSRRDGVGKGYVRIVLDADDNAIGYWEGTYWGEGERAITRPSYSGSVTFGRLVSESLL